MLSKKRPMLLFVFLLFPSIALIIAAAAPGVLAQDEEWEAKLIFETNFTDKDTGIQVFTDGDPWRKVRIFDPDGKLMFDIKGKGILQNFGLTELFSESNEPNWIEDEPLQDIVDRFPEGEYVFEARTEEGEWLEGEATLSHELPCAPDENTLDPSEETVSAAEPIVIDWDPVVNMLDNAAQTCTGGPIAIVKYQVIVENLDNENEFSIFLESSDTQVTIPSEFVKDDTTYKWEVLAIADNGNQTIAETWFCTGYPLDDCSEPED